MTSRNSNRVVIEQLEGRTFMSAVPLAAATPDTSAPTAMHAELKRTAAKTETLARYVVGTWVFTIGRVFGVTMQYKQVYSANGRYVVQVNFKYGANGLPHQTAWTTLDSGTWKAMTGTLVAGVNGLIVARSHNGSVSDVYVHADSATLADFGVLPAGASPNTQADWVTFGRMV